MRGAGGRVRVRLAEACKDMAEYSFGKNFDRGGIISILLFVRVNSFVWVLIAEA